MLVMGKIWRDDVDTYTEKLSNEVSFLFRGFLEVVYNKSSAVNEADGIKRIR